jgi:hypothetical protein
MLSKESMELFEQLLGSYQLQANNPDFDTIARVISQARHEIISWKERDLGSPIEKNKEIQD